LSAASLPALADNTTTTTTTDEAKTSKGMVEDQSTTTEDMSSKGKVKDETTTNTEAISSKNGVKDTDTTTTTEDFSSKGKVKDITVQEDITQSETTPSKTGPANLYFNLDSASVDDAAAREQLTALAKNARCHRSAQVILSGFADPSGTSDYNTKLSAQRAAAVRDSLIQMGVRPQQIVLVAYGDTKAKDDPAARDRRVTAKVCCKASTMTSMSSGG
jgi:outer membrane protein OmpA-like peptidoglycan-associated protein